ncbi:Uma2 family endonuclease [Sorangium sp. So ce1036]|uniref:Uma2 family endonuclease n=1 Tax=Sorangium sp. So ce1036 TaxID=3133328 RepID=UPI003F0682AD
MSVIPPAAGPLRPERATIADWLAEPDERGAELIHGRLVYKAAPSPEHGRAQRKLGALLDAFDGRPGEGGRPGGWWLSIEVDLQLAGGGVRPDLVGWRRDRVPALPEAPPGGAISERPDWVAEVLSCSTAARDLGDKRSIYHAAGVGHYWIIDPANRMLIVYRWTREGYLLALSAGADALVRAEPFDALELGVGLLFGDEGEREAGTSDR